MSRHALIAGATGLVGSRLLDRLLASPHYARISVLARRPLSRAADARLQVIVTDFADLDALGARLRADDVFCCLGTTRAAAGSKAAFAQVDYALVMALARAAKRAGSRQFLLVSAVGASPGALSFYSRVKGRVERDLQSLGFDSLHIVQPSLLLGPRTQARPLEAWMQRAAGRLSPRMAGHLGRYRPVDADTVAAALQRQALRDCAGVHRHRAPFEN